MEKGFIKNCMLFRGDYGEKVLGVFSWVSILSTIAIVIVSSLIVFDEGGSEVIVDAINCVVEEAYYEGQKDAIEGDIRIEKVDGSYVWIESPWDNGQEPIFKP